MTTSCIISICSMRSASTSSGWSASRSAAGWRRNSPSSTATGSSGWCWSGPAGLRGKEQPEGRRAQPAAGANSCDAGDEFRRHQALPAGQAQRSRFHGRALPRRRNAGPAVMGAPLRYQTAALPAPADHADAAGLGRRRQLHAGADRRILAPAHSQSGHSRPSRAPAISCSTRNARRWTRCSVSCRDRYRPSRELAAIALFALEHYRDDAHLVRSQLSACRPELRCSARAGQNRC